MVDKEATLWVYRWIVQYISSQRTPPLPDILILSTFLFGPFDQHRRALAVAPNRYG
jgi:hypothetical protein